jgi:uncharacterized protein (TIGR00725 family)
MDGIASTVIGVIGGKAAGSTQIKEAEEAGRLIARAGAALATGGLGGVMEAASRGAHAQGGLVLGILPGEDKGAANRYVNVAVATGFGIGRNIVLVRTCDALLAVGGKYGTLSEIAYALQMGKPVVGIGSWEIEGVVPAPSVQKAMDIIFEFLGKNK